MADCVSEAQGPLTGRRSADCRVELCRAAPNTVGRRGDSCQRAPSSNASPPARPLDSASFSATLRASAAASGCSVLARRVGRPGERAAAAPPQGCPAFVESPRRSAATPRPPPSRLLSKLSTEARRAAGTFVTAAARRAKNLVEPVALADLGAGRLDGESVCRPLTLALRRVLLLVSRAPSSIHFCARTLQLASRQARRARSRSLAAAGAGRAIEPRARRRVPTRPTRSREKSAVATRFSAADIANLLF